MSEMAKRYMNQELKAGLLLPNIQLANWNGESFKLYNLSGKKY